jgi:hypothetical protein
MVKKKYRALRSIAFVLQVLAWVSLVLTILAAVGAVGAGFLNIVTIPALDEFRGAANTFAFAGVLAGIISALVIIIIGVLDFMVLLAASEFIYVQIDIEQNTRLTAEYLHQVAQTSQVTTTPMAQLPPEPYIPAPTITVPSVPQPK